MRKLQLVTVLFVVLSLGFGTTAWSDRKETVLHSNVVQAPPGTQVECLVLNVSDRRILGEIAHFRHTREGGTTSAGRTGFDLDPLELSASGPSSTVGRVFCTVTINGKPNDVRAQITVFSADDLALIGPLPLK
jgi:hypothetical protein